MKIPILTNLLPSSNFSRTTILLCAFLVAFIGRIQAAEGDLDTTFGTGGIVTTELGSMSGQSMVLQSDGKIVVASSARVTPSSTNDFGITRFNSNGSLDTSFGTNGITISDLGDANDLVSKVLLQPDGKFVVTGFSAFAFTVVRYTSTGVLDSTFGTNGRIITPFTVSGLPVAAGAALQSDGKIVIFGVVPGVSDDFCLIRINANGTVDTSFGTNGRIVVDFNNTYNKALSIVILSDGKILVGGNLRTGTNQTTPIFVRFNSNGTLDNTFGTSGKLEINVFAGAGDQQGFYGLAIQPDGKVVGAGIALGGATGTRANIALARLNADGTLDSSFGTNGTVLKQLVPSTNSIDETRTLSLQYNGKIVVGVRHTRQFNVRRADFAVARFNVDGTIDNTFGVGGFVSTDILPSIDSSDSVLDGLIQPDGKIILSGLGTNVGLALVRYLGTPIVQTTGKQFDFDGDRKADVSVFRSGTWYVLKSSDGNSTGAQWGSSTDKIVPADYNGDGKTDYAVFRDGFWYILLNGGGFQGSQWGSTGDIAVPADYDGDGKADLAVFRNGTWFVLKSAGGTTTQNWGSAGDIPVVADYDNDGKADFAVYRNGIWYVLFSTGGNTAIQWGIAGDKTVPADYNGDGKADYAVFRNGFWYILYNGGGFQGAQWGTTGDLAAPADYDGDGKTDLAVFRAGTWYIQRTTAGVQVVNFGSAGDKPVPNAFVP